MITVGMNYHVIEGQQMAFESAFNKVLAALQAAPGHDSSHLYRDVNDSQSYSIDVPNTTFTADRIIPPSACTARAGERCCGSA
jgi:hypothetical protein